MDGSVFLLIVSCKDKPGIVSAICSFLFNKEANIVDLQQHSTGSEGGTFFLRLEFFTKSPDIESAFNDDFRVRIAGKFQMQYRVRRADEKQVVIPFVSKMDHALMEVLWKWKKNEIHCKIPFVISNHNDLEPAINSFGLELIHIPVTKENKRSAEEEILEKVKSADLLILARYMQILSGDFLDKFKNPVINIHHSFLPAFPGAKPYERAFEKGVKVIGATAHYVTEELDAGPIIEQDVERVNHADNVKELKKLGRETERKVFSRAVQWHLEERIIVHDNKCIVFQ
jgi:formyltetrahydrofolate deformylase